MAHFAKLDDNNIVIDIVSMDDEDTCTKPGWFEREEIGIGKLIQETEHNNWKRFSKSMTQGVHRRGRPVFRANAAQIGWVYDPGNDIFHPPLPIDDDGDACNSYTLNTTTGMWEPPVTRPTETQAEHDADKRYRWDESAYQADNTSGWVLKHQSEFN